MIGVGIAITPGLALAGGGGAACVPTAQIDGNVALNSTFEHPADGVLAWTQTALASSGDTRVRFRIQDANNYWWGFVNNAGVLGLYKTVAGVTTNHGLTGAVVSAGHRVVIVFNDETITVFSNSVQRFTYATAAEFKTATNGLVASLGNSAIADLKVWELSCQAEEGV